MMTRARAHLIRHYLNAGGVVYPGLCKPGSYAIAQLNLEDVFTRPMDLIRKDAHG